jgi:hypothetical protein
MRAPVRFGEAVPTPRARRAFKELRRNSFCIQGRRYSLSGVNLPAGAPAFGQVEAV